MKDKPIYIIANPSHSLGFLVMTDTEPIGFDDPVKALIMLEQLRKTHGTHLKLYQVEQVKGPLIVKSQLKKINMDHALIKEYVKEEK